MQHNLTWKSNSKWQGAVLAAFAALIDEHFSMKPSWPQGHCRLHDLWPCCYPNPVNVANTL